MDEQIRNRAALSLALFILVSLPSCACSYFGSLYFTGNTAWFGAIVAFTPYLVSSLLLLLLIQPHSSNKTSIVNIGKWTLMLTVVSVGLVIWFSVNTGKQAGMNIRDSLILALATWCAGFFGGLTIIAFGSRHRLRKFH